jgi:hypothetical protein
VSKQQRSLANRGRTRKMSGASLLCRLHVLVIAGCITLGIPTVVAAGPIESDAFGPQAVELNFDELADGTIVVDEYQHLGVVFGEAYVDAAPAYAASPPNLIRGFAPITISFVTPVLRVGIQIDRDGYNPGRQPQLLAYDSASNLLGTVDFGQRPDFAGFPPTVPCWPAFSAGQPSACPAQRLSGTGAFSIDAS